MNKNFRLGIFIFSLFLFLPRSNAAQELSFFDSGVTISMDFQDANLKDVLKILSIQSGLNFIASEAVQERKITLYLDKVPLKETLDKLFKANNLTYELDEDANIFIVKEWGKPELETVTKVYYLKYRSVPSANLEKEKSSLLSRTGGAQTTGAGGADILVSIRQVLSREGHITEDTRTNSLIITDVPSRFPQIDRVIAYLDIAQSQIMLDVEILDVSKNMVDKLGFEFGNNPFTLILPGGFVRRGAQFYLGAAADRNREGGITLGSTYAHILDFLRTQTDTKYLARPRLLTLNNETAEISITKDEVVGRQETTTVPTTGGSTTNIVYIRSTDLRLTPEGVGIYLRVTPQINPETNEITMVINPKSSITTPSALASTQADAEVRTTKSIVKVKDGETVILGGILHTDKQVTSKKLPILGDIPFVGALFRHKNQSKDVERELLVFITPHIVKDTGIEFAQAQAKKPSLAEREQDVLSGVDRWTAIDTSLNRFEKKF